LNDNDYAIGAPDDPPEGLSSKMNCIFENNLQGKANYYCNNNKKVCIDSKTGHKLFRAQIIYVNGNNSHIITHKNALKYSAGEEDPNIGNLNNSFDNESKQIDKENELPKYT
jgi:hypothetical protein